MTARTFLADFLRLSIRDRAVVALPMVVIVIAILIGSHALAYDRGVESGMRDLCGEMGGTWTANEHGEYCR